MLALTLSQSCCGPVMPFGRPFVLSLTGLCPARSDNLYFPVCVCVCVGGPQSGPVPTALGSNLTSLVLTSNRLSGSVPSAVQAGALLYLDLALNALTGTLPSTFVGMSTLTCVTMRLLLMPSPRAPSTFGLVCYQEIPFPVRPSYFPPLPLPCPPSIPAPIRRFVLSSNKIAGPMPAAIVGLGVLLSWSLNANWLTGDPSAAGCSALTLLDVSSNWLSGLTPESLPPSLLYVSPPC
jgi:hypothetical protein